MTKGLAVRMTDESPTPLRYSGKREIRISRMLQMRAGDQDFRSA